MVCMDYVWRLQDVSIFGDVEYLWGIAVDPVFTLLVWIVPSLRGKARAGEGAPATWGGLPFRGGGGDLTSPLALASQKPGASPEPPHLAGGSRSSLSPAHVPGARPGAAAAGPSVLVYYARTGAVSGGWEGKGRSRSRSWGGPREPARAAPPGGAAAPGRPPGHGRRPSVPAARPGQAPPQSPLPDGAGLAAGPACVPAPAVRPAAPSSVPAAPPRCAVPCGAGGLPGLGRAEGGGAGRSRRGYGGDELVGGRAEEDPEPAGAGGRRRGAGGPAAAGGGPGAGSARGGRAASSVRPGSVRGPRPGGSGRERRAWVPGRGWPSPLPGPAGRAAAALTAVSHKMVTWRPPRPPLPALRAGAAVAAGRPGAAGRERVAAVFGLECCTLRLGNLSGALRCVSGPH